MARILYTLDATTPAEGNGTELPPGEKFTLPEGTTMVKAVAIKDSVGVSDVAVAAFEWGDGPARKGDGESARTSHRIIFPEPLRLASHHRIG